MTNDKDKDIHGNDDAEEGHGGIASKNDVYVDDDAGENDGDGGDDGGL